ncbi:MAG: helix-turn-helix transcriptional regulator [Treponema sp.]|uniref:helix-turn-helix domain-containing protein n=1 Tax=Treponema sp. TaxID=166 RepID=UPI001B3D41EF|nr:helix-turn-helix transcriptional regulator [Treponema sp.]MBP5402545.1 helix-turn-helix transcriptional regulator [Treponema sp.]MBR5933870.1 helix-turn-helix transcriptional regulator [Treponema sp.]
MVKKGSLSYIIGKNLQIIRKQHHLTQSELAEKIGISVSHVANIESRRASVSLDLVQRILEIFNVSPNDLLLDRNSDNKQNSTTHDKIRKMISDKINSLSFELYYDLADYIPEYTTTKPSEMQSKRKNRKKTDK